MGSKTWLVGIPNVYLLTTDAGNSGIVLVYILLGVDSEDAQESPQDVATSDSDTAVAVELIDACGGEVITLLQPASSSLSPYGSTAEQQNPRVPP